MTIDLPEGNQRTFSSIIHEAISTILPASICIPLSLSKLEELQFTPRKDYEQNHLLEGVLQLANGIHVIVDELVLEAGQLKDRGLIQSRSN
jgi:hypothetical protein